MKKIVLITAGTIVVLGLFLFLLYPEKTPTANAILAPKGDTFTGQISSPQVNPGTYKGMGIYDRSCKMGGNGLTSCDAGITTEEFGTLNFKYTHNMQEQPCIAPNDVLVVTILDKEGNAKVQKML